MPTGRRLVTGFALVLTIAAAAFLGGSARTTVHGAEATVTAAAAGTEPAISTRVDLPGADDPAALRRLRDIVATGAPAVVVVRAEAESAGEARALLAAGTDLVSVVLSPSDPEAATVATSGPVEDSRLDVDGPRVAMASGLAAFGMVLIAGIARDRRRRRARAPRPAPTVRERPAAVAEPVADVVVVDPPAARYEVELFEDDDELFDLDAAEQWLNELAATEPLLAQPGDTPPHRAQAALPRGDDLSAELGPRW